MDNRRFPAETYITLGAVVGIILSIASGWKWPLILVLALGGIPLFAKLLARLWARDLGADLLAGISILTAVLMGQYLVGAILVLMLASGAALEQFATRRAGQVLGALAKRMPRLAHRKIGPRWEDMRLEDVRIGDELIVLPHEICPVDGSVLEGRGTMDESYLTGEPYEMAKTPGSRVLSGAINGEAALTIRAARIAADSRYASIVRVVEAAERDRPKLRRLGDQLGAWYAPLSLAIALSAWALSRDPMRFLAILTVATPCPLIIAIPVAVIGAISLSAKRGIIIRHPSVLEQITRCRTIIFDKTGTLTHGRPALTEIVCAPGLAKEEALRQAASLERYSKHPLAGAILRAASESGLSLGEVNRISEKPGQGLRGEVEGREIWITGRDKIKDQGSLPPSAPGLECLLFSNGAFMAAFRFHDSPRGESKPLLLHFPPLHQITKIMLVSGDREAEARHLAESVGITEVHAGKSPEQKVAIVAEETRRAKTLFVGDGINDAPALLASTVGVAFGPNSDITSEAAGAVVMTASIGKVDELIHIGRRMRAIALQSALGGIGLSLLGIMAAAAGHLTPLQGAVLQEVIDLAAVLNAVRVAFAPRRLTDF